MGWQSRVGRVANWLEHYFDAVLHAYTKYLDPNRAVQIAAYLGFGSARTVYLKGRVLKDKHIRPSRETDTRWRNLRNTWKRFNSAELPKANVQIRVQGWCGVVTADEEGFFEASIDLPERPDPQKLWHSCEFLLMKPKLRAGDVRQSGQFLVPPDTARFGVISDMDDTVVQTGTGNLIGTAAQVLFGNSRTRSPFEGVAAFYQALQGVNRNPLFYVSSSPWNLYDLLIEFFHLHNIPVGPLFLRDWGVSEEEVLPTDHRVHKITTIRRILTLLPELPFLLIGDTGQEDPEIYCELAAMYPGRIHAIYIRDVTHSARRTDEVRAIAEKALAGSCTLLLFQDSAEAASHAASRGWIDT